MLRYALIAILITHGLVHLIGFIVPWRLASIEGFTYKTTVLTDKIDVGPIGIRLVGLLWLIAAGALLLSGYGLMYLYPWWHSLLIGATVFSLVLCVVSLPESRLGIFINIAILSLLAFSEIFGIQI